MFLLDANTVHGYGADKYRPRHCSAIAGATVLTPALLYGRQSQLRLLPIEIRTVIG